MSTLSTDPLDIGLDPATGDLQIINGDFVITSGETGVAQLCRIAVMLVRGEWFLDLDAGIPYYARDGVPDNDAIMGQPYNDPKIRAAYRDALTAVQGVGTVDSVTTSFAPGTRTLTVTWTVVTDFGDTITDTLALGM